MAIALTPALQIASIVSSTFYSLWNLFAVRFMNAVIHVVVATALLCFVLHRSRVRSYDVAPACPELVFVQMCKGFIITWGSQPWYLRWYYYLDPGEHISRPSLHSNGIWHSDGCAHFSRSTPGC
jgi:hypothetical protein